MYTRTVDFSGGGSAIHKEDKKALLERARIEREQRQQLAVQVTKALVIQQAIRSFLSRRRAQSQLRRMYDVRWNEYTTMLAKRTAALKENPMLEANLFPPESTTLGQLVSLWSLIDQNTRERVGRRANEIAADDLKLLSLCAAIVKASMDKTVGSERHNYFYDSSISHHPSFATSSTSSHSSSLTASQSWLMHCRSLVRMLLERLIRETTSGSIKDVKSFALITSCLTTILDPSKWNLPGCNPIPTSPSAAPTSPSSLASLPTCSPTILNVYKQLLEELLYKQQLFTQLKQLLMNMCFPTALISFTKSVSASASSISVSTVATPTTQRPTAFINAILTACFRMVELVTVPESINQTPLLPDVAYVFVTHILTLPSIHTFLTPALVTTITRPFASNSASPSSSAGEPSASSFYTVIYSTLHRLLIPSYYQDSSQSLSNTINVSLSSAGWERLQSILPHWAQSTTLHQQPIHFDLRADIQLNVPAPIHLLSTLLAWNATHFPLSQLSSLHLHLFMNVTSFLLNLLPHSILALADNGKFEFDSEDEEIEAKRTLGDFINTPAALTARHDMLVQLEVLFRQSTLSTCMNHLFLEGFRLLEVEGEPIPNGLTSKTFAERLKKFSLIDADLKSNHIFVKTFQIFTQFHPTYFTALLTLLKSLQDLRACQSASGQQYGSSRIIRNNGMSWLSFSTPFLMCIFKEMEMKIGCELNEDGQFEQPPSTSTNSSSDSSSSTTAAIKAFFGFKFKSKSKANVPIFVTNRNRWEVAILTGRNNDSSQLARYGDAVVTDLFMLWLSFFQPILFILEDEELIQKLPGLTPHTPTTLVSLVHLLKMIVFRLIWNKYASTSEGRVLQFETYADLLQPSQRVLREMYQRDGRRNFMNYVPPTSTTSPTPDKNKKKSPATNKKYESLSTETEMDNLSPESSSSIPVASAPDMVDDALTLEKKASQWTLFGSGGDPETVQEMNSFYREFETWANGNTVASEEGSSNEALAEAQQLFDPTSPHSQRLFHILHDMPFILSFSRRVALLRSFIRADSYQYGYRPPGSQHQVPAYEVAVRREHVVEDGLHAITRLGGRGFKHKLRIKFIDSTTGEEEKGIDLGGPFKEFCETMAKEVFRVEYGLFTKTPGGDYYPNPSAVTIHPDTYQGLFRNIGRIVGKALYENILLDIPLASFFLNRFISQGCVLSDLQMMDAELYKNLMIVKNYPGDVSELGLSFTVDTDVMGEASSRELIRGGENVDVTNENKILYVYKLAHYHLNTKLAPVIQPFMGGLSEMMNLSWCQLFNVSEMRMVLSGSNVHDINVDNWKAFTRYEECSANSKVVLWFWELLSTKFTPTQKAQLLKFSTSCSRPPLEGFKELNPPFTIRIIPVIEANHSSSTSSSSSTKSGFFSRLFSSKPNQAQLPSAATCFNMSDSQNHFRIKHRQR